MSGEGEYHCLYCGEVTLKVDVGGGWKYEWVKKGFVICNDCLELNRGQK